jgi:hypothetical protein
MWNVYKQIIAGDNSNSSLKNALPYKCSGFHGNDCPDWALRAIY